MSDRQDQPTGQGQPSGYEEGGQAGQAGEEGQRDKAGKTRGGVRNPPPPTCTHPTAARRATAGHQQGPPWSQTGPPERGCVPAPAQQHARARSARHTQAKQGTHAAPHASTHHGTKNTTPPRQTPTPDDERAAKNKSKPHSPHSATAAVQMDVCAPGSEPSPCRLRTSRRPDGRVCARQ